MWEPTGRKKVDCFINSFLWTIGVILLSIILYFGVYIVSKFYNQVNFELLTGPFSSKNITLISITLISSVFIEYLFSDYNFVNKLSHATINLFVVLNYGLGLIVILGDEYNVITNQDVVNSASIAILPMTILYSIGMRYLIFESK